MQKGSNSQDGRSEEMAEKVKCLNQENRRLVAIIDGSNAGTWEWDIPGSETLFNEKLADILGYTLDEFSLLSGHDREKLVHDDDLQKSKKLLSRHFSGALDHYELECRMRHKDGSWVYVCVRGKVEPNPDGRASQWMAGTCHDVTDRAEKQDKSINHIKFQKLVIEISTDFIGAESSNVDEKIDSMLEKLGRFFEVDRAHLFIFSEDSAKLTNTHEWCRPGVSPQKEFLKDISASSVPWWTGQIMAGRVVNIPDPEALPANASATEKVLMKQDIKSLLNIPVVTSKRVIGAFGFDMVRKRKKWDPADIDYLKVVANVLAAAEHKLESEREQELLRRKIQGRYYFEDMVSKNDKMLQIFNSLPNIAQSSVSVLIEGESGTGKELLARAIHNQSCRADKPFVKINCGALPETLLESELFGYKAGAFTDAKNDKPGRLVTADGGSLFLDEIGEMTPALQVKLLRVLQDGTYTPVGAASQRKCDIRIISATNKNLYKLVKTGRFREDLYYRIKVMRIVPQPLRERRGDIPLLIKHIIGKFNREKNRNISGTSADVRATLMALPYPGNVRELENIIEHCFVMCNGEVIEIDHLPPEYKMTDKEENGTFNAQNGKPVSLKGMERMLILEALKRNGGNKTAAAGELGIGKRTLYRRLKEYGIKTSE